MTGKFEDRKFRIGIILMFCYAVVLSAIVIKSFINGILTGNYSIMILTNAYGEAMFETFIVTPIVISLGLLSLNTLRKNKETPKT